MALLIASPAYARGDMRPLVAAGQTFAVSAVVADAFWSTVGRRILEMTFERGVFGPVRVLQSMGAVPLMIGCVPFGMVCAAHLHRRGRAASHALLAAGGARDRGGRPRLDMEHGRRNVAIRVAR